MKTNVKLNLFASSLAAMLAACAPAAAPTAIPPTVVAATAAPAPTAVPPTPVPKPTDVPKPTETPKPTDVPKPTETPKPTEVPKPKELVVDKTKLAKQIVVYTWDGYFDEGTLTDFQKEYGTKVKLETFDTNEALYDKFKAGGNPGYDIIVPSDYMVEKLIKEGFAVKIDFNNVPNGVLVDPNHRNLYFDPTSEYSVSHNWGTTGIAYDSAKVKNPPTTWKQVFELAPELKGKIGMLDDAREPLAAALRYQGFSGSTQKLDELEKAKQVLLKQKALVASYKASSDFKKDLVAGDVLVAMMYSNDAIAASADKPSIKYIIPDGTTTIWQDNLVLPKGGKNKYTAEVFMNYLLRPEVAAKNANALGLSVSNIEVMKQGLIDKALLENKALYPDNIVDKVSKHQLEWILHFPDEKVNAAYDRAYNEVLAK